MKSNNVISIIQFYKSIYTIQSHKALYFAIIVNASPKNEPNNYVKL